MCSALGATRGPAVEHIHTSQWRRLLLLVCGSGGSAREGTAEELSCGRQRFVWVVFVPQPPPAAAQSPTLTTLAAWTPGSSARCACSSCLQQRLYRSISTRRTMKRQQSRARRGSKRKWLAHCSARREGSVGHLVDPLPLSHTLPSADDHSIRRVHIRLMP